LIARAPAGHLPAGKQTGAQCRFSCVTPEFAVTDPVRNTLAVIGSVGVFVILLAKPFMAPEWQPWAVIWALTFIGAIWALILIITKMHYGVYLPGGSLAQSFRFQLQHRLRSNSLLSLISLLCFAGVGVLSIVLVKDFHWNPNIAYVAGMIGAIVIIPLFARLLAWRHDRGS
jgi:hypothetical protein